MRKIFITYLFLSCFFVDVKADHITGGEMYYQFAGTSGDQYKYNVTLKIFMVCNTSRRFNDPTYVSVFDRVTGARIKDISIPLSSTEVIQLNNQNPCITNPPPVCYRLGYYHFDVLLPASVNGYLLASQVIYRVEGINNLIDNYNNIGATYTAEIPGTSPIANALENNSAKFSGDDLVVVCSENSFSYSFAAQDDDGDQLRYSFCNAYAGGSGFGENIRPPQSPPYSSVPYSSIYSGSSPLGNQVHIDENTGLITGIAPSSGIYVITVCVEEVRNSKVIAVQRKDLQINITSCSVAAASLPSVYMLCGDTKTIHLSNPSNSPLIETYNWELTNTAGTRLFSSMSATATYTFPDTGLYTIKLVINRNGTCSDSATAEAKVYPGFVPGFKSDGICINKTTKFIDITTSIYGEVNAWSWDFGDNSTQTDTSSQQNPVYNYSTIGTKNVRLAVSNTKGCLDTAFNNIAIVDKPPIELAFRDTLICVNDTLQLNATGSGIFNWSPGSDIINANTSTPIVAPQGTTTYYVELNADGCINHDSVLVNVVDHVTLQTMDDTTVCSGDAIQLNVISNALQYIWTPPSQLNNPAIPNPTAVTYANTRYEVNASVGGCSAMGAINVAAVPYPSANAGPDMIICYQTSAQLHGITDGNSFTWSPQTFLSNGNTLNPVATPSASTFYTLSTYDNKGCPKPGIDTILVTVLPDIHAFAGRDTSAVIEQPLQLKASGGSRYEWSPGTGLSSVNIPNPVALYHEPTGGIRYKVLVYNEASCVDSAFVTIKVFKTAPTVFVPTAFTPNGDGKNDLLKPIAAGMQQVEFFSVYNRWGQLIFSTGVNGKGWDGTVNGIPQSSGTFTWMVKAIDYAGKPYFQKGTVILIR